MIAAISAALIGRIVCESCAKSKDKQVEGGCGHAQQHVHHAISANKGERNKSLRDCSGAT